MSFSSASLLFAVHIMDGILSWKWIAGGFVLMALLVGWGSRRVTDEEVPRVALMSAVFFVASLVHFTLGPTSVHLLLNGLVGVMLGRRAPLAILMGLFLQAVLGMHGGLLSMGVNTCVMALPALLAAVVFTGLERSGWARQGWPRTLLTAIGTAGGSLGIAFFVVLVATNRWNGVVLNIGPATAVVLHPAALWSAAALGIAAAWSERRLRSPPELALGMATGVIAVLGTVVLNALVLLLGGQEEWHEIVTLVLVAHLPLAFIEGIVLGFTVSFLARVRPDLLRLEPQSSGPLSDLSPTGHPSPVTHHPKTVCRPPIWLLALVGLPLLAGPAHAHRLKAEHRVLPDGQVRISSYFAITGDPPEKGKVEVFSPKDHLWTTGELDKKGEFTFKPPAQGMVQVVVSAGAGHRAELTFTVGPAVAERAALAVTTWSWIAQAQYRQTLCTGPAPYLLCVAAATLPDTAETATGMAPGSESSPHQEEMPWKDVLLGVTFLLALAAFVLSIRNARRST
jgi:cobalt/nickel transport system permease protein